MAPGVPARVAVVCILILGMSRPSRAQAPEPRRPVAVIDLAGQPTTSQLARQLYGDLANHPDLQPLPDPAIAAELFGDDEGEDARYLREARAAKDEADAQLARFEFRRAEDLARAGHDALRLVAPTSSAMLLYAQLAFVLGQAQLGQRRSADAATAFALAHRLDPGFAPNAADHVPEVVQAYQAAKPATGAAAQLAVTGTGRVWLDGRDVGIAPLELAAAAGPHVVWLTGADRQTRGASVVVTPGTPATVAIPDAPATERLKVRRARAVLRFAPDPAARAAAMRQLAELVKVRDAVLLSMANGKVIVQTWNAGTRDGAPGFSALREMQPNEPPRALLTPLAPPRPPAEVEPPPIEGPTEPVVVKRWYERRGVKASVAVGVLAAIAGSLYLIRSLQDDTITGDPELGEAMRGR